MDIVLLDNKHKKYVDDHHMGYKEIRIGTKCFN